MVTNVSHTHCTLTHYARRRIVIDEPLSLNASFSPVENREQEAAMFSEGLRALAKVLNIPVIFLSQRNRESQKEPPAASFLFRESPARLNKLPG